MRRFARKRRAGSGRGDGPSPVDAERWLARIREESIVTVSGLEPLTHEDVPPHLAAIGRGETEEGASIVVAVSPRSAGDALLAGLATGARLAALENFAGSVVVVAPVWSLASRRRLGVVRAQLPYTLRTVAAPSLAEREVAVEAEAAVEPTVLSIAQVTAQISDGAARTLFERAAGALDGLAAKHGGTLRGTAHTLELVLMARRVAELRVETGVVSLVTLQPQRSVAVLGSEGLAPALDALEGEIRRRLNDRRQREGEEGVRARLVPVITEACGLRDAVAWPLGGSDHDEIDLAGLDGEGRPVVAAARTTMTLSGVGSFIDAVQSLRLGMPTVFAGAVAPVRLEAPRLVLAAEAFAAGAVRALEGIALAHELFEIRSDRDRGYALASIGAEEAMRSLRDRPVRRRRPSRDGRPRSGEAAESAGVEESKTGAESAETSETTEEQGSTVRNEVSGRGRSRRRGRRRGGRGRDEAASGGEAPGDEATEERAEKPRFEEVSLFDLEDDAGESSDDSSGVRRRRGRGGRRGRRSGRSAESGDRGAGDDDEAPKGGDDSSRRERPPAAIGEDEEDEFPVDDLTEVLSELPEELAVGAPEVEVEEDGDDEEERDETSDGQSLDLRRRGRAAVPLEAEIEAPRPRRRRAVIVARADRDSLVSAILLARDIRLLEGLWIYPQSELMGFFREVATDLGDDVPIHVVGFAPSPVIDVLQAASLYRDRISWYDHHSWAPEDDLALKQALGEESVHHTPGAGSSLPAVLETCTRRSRFTDKLVDLATGRFSQHDYERWGRLWWWRLGEISEKRGQVRNDVSALLTGRPSDLAKEASKTEAPPVPKEVAYISERDFRLVHFAGYVMVVAEVDVEYDVHLLGRIARERYSASLSLMRSAGSDLFFFGGEELAGRRALDSAAFVDYLASKLDWVTALPNDDHIARFRIEGLVDHAERLDEVIGEIAMGRSILER